MEWGKAWNGIGDGTRWNRTHLVTNDDFSQQVGQLGQHGQCTQHPITHCKIDCL